MKCNKALALLATYAYSMVQWVEAQYFRLLSIASTIIAVVTGFSIWLIVLIYCFMARGGATEQKTNAQKWRLRAAILFVIGVPFLLTGIFASTHYWRWRETREPTILITEFEGPDKERHRITETLQHDLKRSLLQENGQEDVPFMTQLRSHLRNLFLFDDSDPKNGVEIICVPETILEHEGSIKAKKLGKKHRADIVIWGWYGGKPQSYILCTNIQILPAAKPVRQALLAANWPEHELLVSGTNAPEDFRFQSGLGNNMAYQAHMILGLAQAATQNWEASEDHFNKALCSIKKLIKDLEEMKSLENSRVENRLAKLQENRVFLHLFAGHSYLQEGGKINKAKAIDSYNDAIKQIKKIAQDYFTRATNHHKKREIPQADDCENKALEQNKRLAEAYKYRAIAYRENNNFEPAALDFKRARIYKTIRPDTSELNVKYAQKRFDRGHKYLRENELVHAEADFLLAVDIFKRLLDEEGDTLELAKSLTGLGEVYRRRGKTSDALAELTEAIQICEKEGPSPKLDGLHARSLRNRGEAHLASKEFNRAIEDQNKALDLYNRLLERARKGTEQRKRWQNEVAGQETRLGNIYFDKGELDNALAHYKSAIKIRELLVDEEKPWKLANHLADSRARKAAVHLKRRKEDDLAEAKELLSEAEKGFRTVMNRLEVDANLTELLKGEGDADFRDDIASLLTVRGNLLLNEEEWPKAEMALKEAKAYYLELMRENKEEFEATFAWNLFSLAKAQFKQYDKEAKKTYKEALKILLRVIEKKGKIWYSDDLYRTLGIFLEDSNIADDEKRKYEEKINTVQKWLTGTSADEGRKALVEIIPLLSKDAR